MKNEEEITEALNKAVGNAVRSESIKQLRFYQGQINILEWYFAKPEERQDGFKDE